MDAHAARKRGLSPKNGGTTNPKRNKTDDLELLRLLNVMENDPAPKGISWQQLEGRTRLCQQLFEKTSNKALKSRVDAVCQEADQAVTNLKAREASTPNPVEKIFKKQGTVSHTPSSKLVTPEKGGENKESGPSVIKKINTSRKNGASKNVDVAPTSTTANVADLQKQQREQMEAAVAQMASQMKDQTSRLHSTIKGQTDNLLDTMENVTLQNVEDVTQVAAATQEQVKRSWRRSAATWTLFFTIVGAFVGTLITIQVVPKAEMKDLFSALCAHEQANKVCVYLSETIGSIPPTIQRFRQELAHSQEHLSTTVEDPHPEQESEPVHQTNEAVETKPEQLQEETLNPKEEVEPEEETNQVVVPIEQAANAIFQGDVTLLRSYLEQQPSLVSAQDGNGWSLLHEAAWNGKLEIAAILVEEYNCNKHMANFAGKSPLDLALIASDGNTDHPMVRLLQDPPAEEVESDQAVEIDAKGEQHEIKVPEGIDAEKLREATLREFAEMQNSHISGSEEDLEEQKRLEEERLREEELKRELAQRQREEQHRQFQEAQMARERQNQEQVENLEEYPTFEGKPFSARDLRRAATRGDVRRILAFLELRPDILDQQDQNQWTALHLAVRSGRTDAVRALLEAGADTQARNNMDMTPMDLAISKLGDEHEIVSLLEQYGN